MTVPVSAAVILLLLVVAAFSAMAETAVTRTSRVKAHHLTQEKRRNAELLLRIV
jgi:Mg2+/Co2+ transporter CorB